jgi:hypothetical protein
MQSVNVDLLKQVIEIQHGGKSEFAQSVRVAKWSGHPSSWDGVVHIFTLTGHPTARRAFAWSSPIAGSHSQRYFAVLQQGRVRTPAEAAKAAAAAIFAAAQPQPPKPANPAVLINPLLLEAQ